MHFWLFFACRVEMEYSVNSNNNQDKLKYNINKLYKKENDCHSYWLTNQKSRVTKSWTELISIFAFISGIWSVAWCCDYKISILIEILLELKILKFSLKYWKTVLNKKNCYLRVTAVKIGPCLNKYVTKLLKALLSALIQLCGYTQLQSTAFNLDISVRFDVQVL